GIETRIDDPETKRLLSFLNHKETEICIKAERSFLKELGGGCQIPIAAKASIKGGRLQIKGLVSDLEAKRFLKETLTGDITDPDSVGKKLAEHLLKKGAEQILKEVYHG
ncbi:MAG: hydroxymethylbilane synthase, partial [Deltaproteobacteria bacterium]